MPESVVESLRLYLVAAVLPAMFLVLWIAFRWRFNRALGKVMYDGKSPGATSNHPRLTLTPGAPLEGSLLAASRPQRNQDILGQAKHDAATLRRVFVVAGIVHLILAFSVITAARSSESSGWTGAIGVAYYHLAPQLLILLILLRARWHAFGIAAVCWFAGFVTIHIAAGRTPGTAVSDTFRTIIAGSDNFGVPTILVGLLALRPLSTLMTSLAPLGLIMFTPAPFLIAWTETLEPAQTEVSASAGVLSLLSIAIGVTVACWAIRYGHTRRVAWVFVALTGVAAAGLFVPDPVSLPLAAIGGIGVNGLIIFLLAALLTRFARLKTRGWLTDDVLQSVLCWGVLAIWTIPLLVGSDAWILVPWVGYIAALIGGLYLRSTRFGAKSSARLVLLRVFGRSRQQRRLLDGLGSTWRHVGRIDLVAGLDLALPALSALALRDFLLSRARWYVADEDDAERRMATLSSERAIDGRYPINEIYAGATVWRAVVELLLVDAQCVLIDLRGFTEQNEGAAYELGVAVTHVPLDRLVVLVDKDSDCAAIGDIVTEAWKRASLAPTFREQQLRVLLCAGREPQDSESIMSEVFSAWGVTASTPSPLVGQPALQH